MKTITIFSTIIISSTLSFGTNCSSFSNSKNKTLCSELSKKGVSMNYINSFLTQEKSFARDVKTLKLIAPKEIKEHRKKEKKANNNLLKHLDFASKHLSDYSEVYDYVEKKYNVDREIIVGILLKETIIGTYKPKHQSFVTLNTVYQETTPDTKRNKWLVKLSKENLVYLGQYCFKNKIKAPKCDFSSSYIGAIGIPQFMPMNLWLAKSYRNNVPDLTNLEDAIVSVGNYFNKMASYKKLIDWESLPNIKSVEEAWYDFDFKNDKSSFVSSKKN